VRTYVRACVRMHARIHVS